MEAETGQCVPSSALRVLVLDERPDEVERLRQIVAGLGHDAVARCLRPAEFASAAREAEVEIAVVVVPVGTDDPIALLSKLVDRAACPVVAFVEDSDACFVGDLADTGVYGFVLDQVDEHLAGALDMVFRRFADYRNLENAFGRRAIIERAKGILMARKGLDERKAFELLRAHSQRTGRKLLDIAQAVQQAHDLF